MLKKNTSNSDLEALDALIKKAGQDARKLKKKTMDDHVKKIHDAVWSSLSTMVQDKSI